MPIQAYTSLIFTHPSYFPSLHFSVDLYADRHFICGPFITEQQIHLQFLGEAGSSSQLNRAAERQYECEQSQRSRTCRQVSSKESCILLSLLFVFLPISLQFSPVLPFARQDELSPKHESWEEEANGRLFV